MPKYNDFELDVQNIKNDSEVIKDNIIYTPAGTWNCPSVAHTMSGCHTIV